MNEQIDHGMRLNDDVWRLVVQFVQLAMLTGVDVVDYFRQIKVKPNGDGYSLGDGQKELFDRLIEQLTSQIAERAKNVDEGNGASKL